MTQRIWYPCSRVVMACLLLAACSQDNDRALAAESTASAQTGFAAILASYEAARAALARDRISDAVSVGGRMEASAKAAKADVAAAQHATLDALAKAAAVLSQQPPDKAAAVRRAFGEVSRHLIAILRAAPKLREGLYLFECPMAEDFKQWVGRSEEVENPYMGSRMLHCGSKRKF